MQKIHLGSCEYINECLNHMQTKKFMLVCGTSYESLPIKKEIEALDVPYVKFTEFSPNPLYEDVVKGVEKFNDCGCDSIIAVGGGSAIDVAKCIKLYSKMNKKQCFLEQKYYDTKIPFTAVPTTAGTGSESTRYAVIYYEGKKQSVTHDSIVPDLVILDKNLIKTLPLYQKKCTLLDALCQGIESWWSVNSTDESKEYSKMAVSLIAENMQKYIQENDDNATEKILIASNCAGRAINITQTTAAHAMSYKLTSMYNVPHGHAVALCLPLVWDKMLCGSQNCIDNRGYEYLRTIFEDIAKALGCSCIDEAIGKLYDIFEDFELGYPSSKNKDQDIQILTASVNITRLSNNPIKFDISDLAEIYERILKS